MKQLSGLALGVLLFNLPSLVRAAPIPEDVASELMESSGQELDRLFDLRNHKGEKVLGRKRGKKDLEAGIWATRDPKKNGLEGTSTDLLYRKFKVGKSSATVVVAVIDSGVDISHPELKNKLWTNEAELRGKPGVDDDGDGFVDDIYGWNFIGNRDGRNLKECNLEVARVYSELKKKEASGALNPSEIALLEKAGKDLFAQIEKSTRAQIKFESFAAAIRLLKSKGLKEETLDALDGITATDAETETAIALARSAFLREMTLADIEDGLEYFRVKLKYHLNPAFDPSSVIGDDPDNLNETFYGNPDVTGPDAEHGTHVAGIIAADRENSFGIEGQANQVKIMPIRAVPDGDERDKDVANAIRFAVDHGAQIINMSFGKAYSPGKAAVDEAVRYAETKGVLLVHSAGNESRNTEGEGQSFPNRNLRSLNSTARNWIEVGASGPKRDETLAAGFSNYGKSSVDVFAPGVAIISTTPGNQYATMNGTSMASPEVAGVAAILMGMKPAASASEVKEAILSTVNLYPGLQCNLPGEAKSSRQTLVAFESLSASGGTVNALEALKWLLAR
jgi:subtilisin family serine protease